MWVSEHLQLQYNAVFASAVGYTPAFKDASIKLSRSPSNTA